MFGKMSVGVRRADATPKIRISTRHDDEGVRTPKRELDDADHNCLTRWRVMLARDGRQTQPERPIGSRLNLTRSR